MEIKSIEELPEEIDGYSRRVFEIIGFCVIEYSKKPCFYRFLNMHSNIATTDILYEVLERDIETAVANMKTKLKLVDILKSENKVDGFVAKVDTYLVENNIFYKPFEVFICFNVESNIKKILIVSVRADIEYQSFLNVYNIVIKDKHDGIRLGLINGEELISGEAKYNNKIYLYTNKFEERNKEDLIKILNHNKIRLKVSDQNYRNYILNNMSHQVFICHDYRDKNFARELAEQLKNQSIKPWYDEYEIKYGDSIIDKMTDGISNTEFGIIILSENLFKNKGAANFEFKSFLQKSFKSNRKILIPIWHNVGFQEVYNFMPYLVDINAPKSEIGATKIAQELKNIIK
ncbi:MAG: toll/interleukin-1 receptor domain-containing protein [Campylobacterales bacterium]|nr:toll/interleukin-1 receptor domain-containing protein [Campylobacterales bacterium]